MNRGASAGRPRKRIARSKRSRSGGSSVEGGTAVGVGVGEMLAPAVGVAVGGFVAPPSQATTPRRARRAAIRMPFAALPITTASGLPLLSARVGPLVDLPEVVARQVGVDLGGRDVGVTQHLLDVPQGHAATKHVGGEGVAQGVRGYVLAQVRGPGVALEDEPEALSGETLAAPVEEQRLLAAG